MMRIVTLVDSIGLDLFIVDIVFTVITGGNGGCDSMDQNGPTTGTRKPHTWNRYVCSLFTTVVSGHSTTGSTRTLPIITFVYFTSCRERVNVSTHDDEVTPFRIES